MNAQQSRVTDPNNWNNPSGDPTPWLENRPVINLAGAQRAVIDATQPLIKTNVLYIGTPIVTDGAGEVYQTGGTLTAYRVPTPNEAGEDHWIGLAEHGTYTITGGRLIMGGNSVHIGELDGIGVFNHLDGEVDGKDYNIWNTHKFTSGTDWPKADFNGDRLTDTTDFNIWNSNQGT